MKKVIFCDSCEGECKVSHSMDNEHYPLKYCPFCGEKLDDEYQDDVEDYSHKTISNRIDTNL